MEKNRVYACFLRILAGVLCLTMLSGALAGCAGKKQNYDVNTEIVASVNGDFIYLVELNSAVEETFAALGIADGELDEDERAWYYQMKLDELIEQMLERQQMEKQGLLELSAEEQKTVKQQLSQELSDRYDYYYEMAKETFPDADQAELEKYTEEAVAEYVADSGETDEFLYDTFREEVAREKLYHLVTKDVTAEESELREQYEEYVREDREYYEKNPDYFESDKTTNAVYYNPCDARYIRHIIVSDLGTAHMIREKLDGGADFDALMQEYSEDETAMQYPLGFAVCEDSEQYAESYIHAAYALENPGEFSDVVEVEDGLYVILRYERPILQGAESYEDMREYLQSELLSDKRGEVYQQQLEQWKEQADIDIFEDVYLNS